MLKRMATVLFLMLQLSSALWAGGHNFGLGFILGKPTALSAKYWTSGTTALDFGLGWGLGYSGYDERCWDGGFYDKHTNYCNDHGYNYRYRDDRYSYRGLHLHADYLIHNFNLIRTSEKFPLYYGPGISLNFWNHGNTDIGMRGVIGIAWMPRSAPIDVFLEIAPVLYIFPGIGMDPDVGLGARFYF